MAARRRPLARHRTRHGLALAAIAAVALGAPGRAQAHSGTPVDALDFKARVVSVGRHPGSIRARVLDGDRKLDLRVGGSSTVVVLGYEDEPFLRFSTSGVSVNERPPTAIANGLAPASSIALAPAAAPTWRTVSDGRAYAWHDHRLGPAPGHTYRQGDVTRWAIPIVVDGRADQIVGRLSYKGGPRAWPWLVLLAVTLAIAAVLASKSKRLRMVRIVLVAGAAVAGLAALLLTASLTLVPGRGASSGAEGVVVGVLVASAAVAGFVAARRARDAIAGFVALLAALVGIGDLGVLVHGYVISSLPAALVRGATACAVGVGLIAAACAAGLLFRADGGPPARGRSSPAARRQMAVPRRTARTP